MKEINIKELLAEFEDYSPNLGVTSSDVTSKNAGHRHEYIIDKNGNGEAYLAVHPNNPKIKHKHIIKNYIVLEAQSSCYPSCKSQYGNDGVGPHGHVIKKEVVIENSVNFASTSEVYKSREKYKKQVNKNNLPIGEQTSNGKVLNNQLDLWYKRPRYGKYNQRLNLIKLKLNETKFKAIGESDFSMLDFAADAVNGFLEQYNVEREEHPQSILNNLQAVKAYTPEADYDLYFFAIYVKFFNDVLDGIKKTNKIKNIDDFIKLFYSWASSNSFPITETGFYESRSVNIYNTGLAFDFIQINSEDDKKRILNDVRFPVLNYVAKVNGLRIDPNYPGRLIVDIYSKPLLQRYASNYFFGDYRDIPKRILKKYFIEVDYQESSENKISSFFKNISDVYDRFVFKYPNYATHQSNENFLANKEKFQTSRIKRKNTSHETFFNTMEGASDGSDVAMFLSKRAMREYVRFRLLETDVRFNKGQINKIIETMFVLNTISNKLDYVEMQPYEIIRHISSQAVNYLESLAGPSSVRSELKDKTKKKHFVYLWDRTT